MLVINYKSLNYFLRDDKFFLTKFQYLFYPPNENHFFFLIWSNFYPLFPQHRGYLNFIPQIQFVSIISHNFSFILEIISLTYYSKFLGYQPLSLLFAFLSTLLSLSLSLSISLIFLYHFLSVSFCKFLSIALSFCKYETIQ